MGTVKQNADIKFRSASLIFTVNMYPTGGGNNNNNNNNNNNAVLVARGGWKGQNPAINPRALRDGRKGDPIHKCCGKNKMAGRIRKNI